MTALHEKLLFFNKQMDIRSQLSRYLFNQMATCIQMKCIMYTIWIVESTLGQFDKGILTEGPPSGLH